MPLTPPVKPCWPMMSTVRISATACVMMAKYTPPTRRLNIAKLIRKASSVGTSTTASSGRAGS